MIRKGYVDTTDGQIHYRRTEGGTCAPLAFFHMTASSSEAYDPLMRELDGKVPMVAFDSPNYGESYRTTREPTIRYMADVLLEALSGLGIERFHTFGHHTGVSIQAEMAANAPGRVLSTIMNGPTFARPDELAFFADRLAKPNPISSKGTQLMWAWSRIKDNAASSYFDDTPHLAEILHRDTVDMLRAGENWHWAYRAVFSHDLVAAMERMRCPIFFICGQHDPSFPLHAAAVAAYPSAGVHVCEVGGTYYIESHPEDAAPVIERFIRSIGS